MSTVISPVNFTVGNSKELSYADTQVLQRRALAVIARDKNSLSALDENSPEAEALRSKVHTTESLMGRLDRTAKVRGACFAESPHDQGNKQRLQFVMTELAAFIR